MHHRKQQRAERPEYGQEKWNCASVFVIHVYRQSGLPARE